MSKLKLIRRSEVGDRELQSVDWDGKGPVPVLLKRDDWEQPVSYCGRCETPLMVGIDPQALRQLRLVLLCPGCDAYNDAPDPER